MENLTGISAPVRPLPCVVPCKLYFSTPKITISPEKRAAPQKEATIARYNVSFDGKTTSLNWSDTESVSVTLDTATSAGNMKLKVSALDSRSFTRDVSKDVYVIPYSAPVAIASGRRLNDFENETTIHIEGSISPIQVNGVSKNAVDSASGVKYRYREQGSSIWNNWTNVKSATGANGVVGTTDFTLSLDKTKAYEFQVQISDKLKTSTVDFIVGIGQPIFRIGINDKLCYNNEQPLMPSHVGQVIQSTTLDTAEKVAAVYGGTWVTWGAGRVPVGVSSGDADFGTVNKTGGDKTVTLTVDQMPKHSHKVGYAASEASGTSVPYVDRHNLIYSPNNFYPSTQETGGNKGHTNLPPYQTLYMWKRTV